MPGLDPKVAIHHLAVKNGARPVKQAQRRFRSDLVPLIESEVNKLIETGFIREVKYPTWDSSIIPARKKNGQIWVCVDFRDLNNVCPKDEFLFPIPELMIDATTGYEAMSFMDGSSGYNQIRMAPKDEELTAFHTPKAQERSVGALLAQKDSEGKENSLYYLSRMMTPNELNYSPIKKLCLELVFSIQKLKHYFQAHVVRLVSRANPIKFVMSKPILSDRLARWYLQFQQFEIVYIPQKAIKGQALADFLADHLIPDDWELTNELPNEDAMVIEVQPPWKMYFDGSAYGGGVGTDVVFVTSQVLHPTVASWLFDAWGLDIIGLLSKSSGGHLYILAASDYFSKWAEVVALNEVKKENIASFIRVNIIYRFGIPHYIIMGNGKQRNCSIYNVAANGLAEALNKTLCNLLKKVFSKSKRDWHDRMEEALWSYRTTHRTTTQATPYSLIYGVEAILPLERQIPSLRLAIQEGITDEENARL
ncbi:uncharacterized protein [Nicotiana tomentosiformis]|uniref:uncharacterized protein n=1 Tax=Nicotiana tomentosiformis TaxID=4098 RepID=UPI00388C48C3